MIFTIRDIFFYFHYRVVDSDYTWLVLDDYISVVNCSSKKACNGHLWQIEYNNNITRLTVMEDGHAIQGSNPATRVKNQQFVNKLYPHCLHVLSCRSKMLSSCRNSGEANRIETSCSKKSDIVSTYCNKLLTSWWQQAHSNLLQTVCISLVETTRSKSVTVIISRISVTMLFELISKHHKLILVLFWLISWVSRSVTS